MRTISQCACAVIPHHMLTRLAEQADAKTREDARSTLEEMRRLADNRARTFAIVPDAVPTALTKRLSVYDARHSTNLPGRIVTAEPMTNSRDVAVREAYDGCTAALDFYGQIMARDSIDGRGMRVVSSVHYSKRFDNAMWNGSQMVYGDGDGRLFNRFTASRDVIGHELTHGVTQYSANLGYHGENGALNEHISDAFGIMIKQFTLGQSANQSDWRIGAELFTSRVHGTAIRSMAAPGTAYDDPILGRDPQPSHMRNYVDTSEDNGGVHINSGIPNYAFYLAATKIGGKTWELLGRLWYVTLTERLNPNAGFQDFAQATVNTAEQLGNGVQHVIVWAWSQVGIATHLSSTTLEINARPIKVPRHWLERPAAPPATQRNVSQRKENNIMSTTQEHFDHFVAARTHAAINRSIKALGKAGNEMENAAIADTPGGRIQKLAQVYAAIKPLLTAVSTLSLIPQTWRAALALFTAAVEAVVATPELNADFKAGKDL